MDYDELIDEFERLKSMDSDQLDDDQKEWLDNEIQSFLGALNDLQINIKNLEMDVRMEFDVF